MIGVKELKGENMKPEPDERINPNAVLMLFISFMLGGFLY
jgi:hypothetical protein